MKKIYTLITGLLISATFANAQVIFQSNLSSWNNGKPDGFWGSSTNLAQSNITQVGAVMYGTSAAKVKNTGTSHKRFTTQTLNVDAGATYEVKFYVKADTGFIRTNYYELPAATYGTYNNYLDLKIESNGQLVELTQTVTVSATTDSAQFIFSFHSTDSLSQLIIDSVVITNTVPPVATPYTIYQLQYTTTPPYDSPHNGEFVETSGIVTAVQYNGYYIQDAGSPAYNGIFVLDYVNVPAIGDNITISGTVEEYFNFTEIKNPSSYNVNSSGNSLPNAVNLTTLGVSDEAYEGVLVKVSNATCTVDTATNGNGEWTVNDGSGAATIDNKMYSYNAIVTTKYNVTGVVDYSFSAFKVQPRNANDVEIATAIQEVSTVKTAVYPNPAQNFITFEQNVNFFAVKVIDITGKTVCNTSTESNKLVVNTSALNNGIYFYTILNKQGEVTSNNKFIIAK